ncbi:activating signal cointegrator 1 [Pyrus ussuriensis x Pyrus communis]|uniref:Activating signal cointegrator 1 n=1 Tax=Pyrus ussuriensis x Pyrus communis TaxID=2448454 RepID=A0A5N5I536_9ROSA|nr:activating signal cointegrator 1 [Pyrus ussuriensis x Pyrus communis]
MVAAGEWLKKALVDLYRKMETGGLDKDMISGLVSYCELTNPHDAKEYLDNIIGQEVGKFVIEEYLPKTGSLHAYVKPPSNEGFASGTKKPLKTPKVAKVPSDQAASNNQVKQLSSSNNTSPGNSKKKKVGKVFTGSTPLGNVGSNNAHAKPVTHRLVSNCLSCRNIVCEEGGEGPCNFCGALMLKEGSTYVRLEESFAPTSDAEAVAEAYAKRLKQEEIVEVEQIKRSKVVVSFDLVGRKVLVNEDEASEVESESRILRPQDEKEVNCIKPNLSLKVQPVFVDPGPSKKPVQGRKANKTLIKGLCLEITGRVQHVSDELKHFMVDNQLETASNGKFAQGTPVSGGTLDDDGECFLDFH